MQTPPESSNLQGTAAYAATGMCGACSGFGGCACVYVVLGMVLRAEIKAALFNLIDVASAS